MPESIRLPLNHPSYLTILSLHLYLSFVYEIPPLLHLLQHWYEVYSAYMVQMSAWKGSYAYEIALSTTNLAAAY